MKKEGGLTLVEVLVAALILASISLAIFSYFSYRSWNDVKVSAKCLLVLQNKLDEIQATDYIAIGNGSQAAHGCQLQWVTEVSASPAYKSVTATATYGGGEDKVSLMTIVPQPL